MSDIGPSDGFENPVFPIRTETSCLLKWAWSTIYLRQGTSSSCHRTDQTPIPRDDFGSFHNLPNKIRARQMMRRGEWPREGCQYCENIERAGGVSDRQYQFLNHTEHDRTPQELLEDPNTDEVVPTILEIYFNNICNMSCLYCGSHFSSKWEEENRRFGEFKQGVIEFGWNKKQDDNDYNQRLADFWRYLSEQGRYLKIRQYQIAGGEPFFQPELDMSIDFWEQHPNPNLTFNFITNLKVPPKKFRAYIDRFGKMVDDHALQRVQISASIDGWGPQQEYVRYGLDCGEWQENFEYILDKPWVIKCINAAINPLSIKTMPELIRNINRWQDLCDPENPISFSFMSVMAPQWMDPAVFGPGVFEQDFQKILAEMRETNKSEINARHHIQGIARQIAAAPRNQPLVDGLKIYLDEIDRRRGTNWRSLFPWLIDL